MTIARIVNLAILLNVIFAISNAHAMDRAKELIEKKEESVVIQDNNLKIALRTAYSGDDAQDHYSLVAKVCEQVQPTGAEATAADREFEILMQRKELHAAYESVMVPAINRLKESQLFVLKKGCESPCARIKETSLQVLVNYLTQPGDSKARLQLLRRLYSKGLVYCANPGESFRASEDFIEILGQDKAQMVARELYAGFKKTDSVILMAGLWSCLLRCCSMDRVTFETMADFLGVENKDALASGKRKDLYEGTIVKALRQAPCGLKKISDLLAGSIENVELERIFTPQLRRECRRALIFQETVAYGINWVSLTDQLQAFDDYVLDLLFQGNMRAVSDLQAEIEKKIPQSEFKKYATYFFKALQKDSSLCEQFSAKEALINFNQTYRGTNQLPSGVTCQTGDLYNVHARKKEIPDKKTLEVGDTIFVIDYLPRMHEQAFFACDAKTGYARWASSEVNFACPFSDGLFIDGDRIYVISLINKSNYCTQETSAQALKVLDRITGKVLKTKVLQHSTNYESRNFKIMGISKSPENIIQLAHPRGDMYLKADDLRVVKK